MVDKKETFPPEITDARVMRSEETLSNRPQDRIQPLHVVEQTAILEAIHLCDGHIIKAAACLEVAPSTLYRKLKKIKNEPKG